MNCMSCRKFFNPDEVPFFAGKCCLCWDRHVVLDGWTSWWRDKYHTWQIGHRTEGVFNNEHGHKMPESIYKQDPKYTLEQCVAGVKHWSYVTRRWDVPINILVKARGMKIDRSQWDLFIRAVLGRFDKSERANLTTVCKELRSGQY